MWDLEGKKEVTDAQERVQEKRKALTAWAWEQKLKVWDAEETKNIAAIAAACQMRAFALYLVDSCDHGYYEDMERLNRLEKEIDSLLNEAKTCTLNNNNPRWSSALKRYLCARCGKLKGCDCESRCIECGKPLENNMCQDQFCSVYIPQVTRENIGVDDVEITTKEVI